MFLTPHCLQTLALTPTLTVTVTLVTNIECADGDETPTVALEPKVAEGPGQAEVAARAAIAHKPARLHVEIVFSQRQPAALSLAQSQHVRCISELHQRDMSLRRISTQLWACLQAGELFLILLRIFVLFYIRCHQLLTTSMRAISLGRSGLWS